MEPPGLDRRLERPLHPGDPDRVHVGVEEQRLAAAGAARDPDDVEAPGSDLLDLDLEPGRLEPAGDEARDLALARRALDQVRVDRVDADEVGEELGAPSVGLHELDRRAVDFDEADAHLAEDVERLGDDAPPARASSRLSTR